MRVVLAVLRDLAAGQLTLRAMSMDRDQVIAVLNEILEIELAGVVRYTHYSLMIFGHARIPITKWFREQPGR